MKKLVFFLSFCFISAAVCGQSEFPYSKMLHMSDAELKDANFKRDANRNQWVLQKSNGLQATANVLSALAGTSADIKPDVNDYQIIIQGAEEGVALVQVRFYNDATYHDLLTFVNDRCENVLETNSGKLSKIQCEYGGYRIELNRYTQQISTTTARTSALTKTMDDSYNIYHYIIFTGKEASSAWHSKQKAKAAKRDAKDKKKRSVAELM